MSYSEIIRRNCEKYSEVSWWPRFAFHYTDVTNAVGILDSGYLYSRYDATHLKKMNNDNASRQVIEITNSDIKSMVRFYFRPLTPTQYYNEGYKHPAIRYDRDPNANTPVPIFFLFDLGQILSLPDTCFSETSQAGRGAVLMSGEDNFARLNFGLIYSRGFENFEEAKPYRHAEIVHPGPLEISPYLKKILCRNDIERATLLNLLKEKNISAYHKYRDIIKVYEKDTFENNGLFITQCLYHENTVSISFSDSYNKQSYMRKQTENFHIKELFPISTGILFCWFCSGNVVLENKIETMTDYVRPKSITVTKLPSIAGADEIGVKVFFEDKLMCYMIQSSENDEIIK